MKKTLLLIVILSVFLNGCVGVIQTDPSNQDNWRTGTQGVVMNFVPNNPPSEVVSSSDVLVYVELANKGATDATELKFHLTGFDDSILDQFDSEKHHENLPGKTKFNPEGSQEHILKWSSRILMGSLAEIDSFKQAFVVTACYRYKTEAYPQICVDPTQFDVIGPSECDYSVKDLGASQGAPIVVTKVEKKMSTDKIFLEIEFQNKGSGNPYVKGSCLRLEYDQIDKINIVDEKVGSGRYIFNCNPSTVRLVNNRGFTICETIDGFNMPDTLSEIQVPIKISYYYRDSLPKKEITIVNVN